MEVEKKQIIEIYENQGVEYLADKKLLRFTDRHQFSIGEIKHICSHGLYLQYFSLVYKTEILTGIRMENCTKREPPSCKSGIHLIS